MTNSTIGAKSAGNFWLGQMSGSRFVRLTATFLTRVGTRGSIPQADSAFGPTVRSQAALLSSRSVMDGLRPTAIITVDAVGLDMVSGVMATSAPLLLALRRAVTVARADPEAPRVDGVREDRQEAEADPVPEAQSQRRRA